MVLKILTIFCFFFIAIITLGKIYNININITASYPVGLYRSHKVNDFKSEKNSLAMFCPDPSNIVIQKAVENNIFPIGTECEQWGYAPLLKKIVGVPGDRIVISKQGVAVNGKLILNSIIKYRAFSILVSPGYTHRLGLDEYWLMSDYSPNSLDSRYIGPIKASEIFQITQPIFTTRYY